MESTQDWNGLDGPALQKALQEYCTSEGISDIHFSPEKKEVRLEVRLHGILKKIATLEHKTYVDFVRQIKFLSKLKLNVTNIPQDGHYTFNVKDRVVNVRVASIPSRFGEKFTLRLLDPARGIVPLPDLGFPEEIHGKLEQIAQLPNGIFLITGPTGSGKTTTLYALLNTIAGKDRNIITLEDPVEYELPGIVQSQIDPDHDYTFATGLRSILRHDPDVILVGEIRDYETAQTAIDAALTGHLVLSTLHTNSAVEAIPRLLAMGVSPYTFAPALRAVLAQRLVRTVKDDCKGGKCDPSDNATYDGRMALPELLVVTPKIRQTIIDNEPAEIILEEAKKEGYRSMQEWGKILIDNDDTTESEIMRVTM
ncbi:MAG: GspE/PulE family protein [Candidatus Peribacteraceae bacterium]|jgi:type II secretory ATPase GspE/PulE/Tfp pilus assembly ATPase PilB-like protein|nr:GspE/PulE family protein [Candidatus Peribacteraceae bacterium]